MERRVAVCDLGSNSFRLVVFTAADGWWKRTDEIYEAVRIGAGLVATGRLEQERIERAIATTMVFKAFCAAAGVAKVDAVATSAVRDAANADDFLDHAHLAIRVLSREEEAWYGYLAAVNSTTLADGAVLDLGGGSLQLTRVASRHSAESGSWPLGAVRMTERFGLAASESASKKQLRALSDHTLRKLADAPWLARSGQRIVGIGGTVRNLAAAAQRAAGLPEFGVQGHVVTATALDEIIDRLASLPAPERAHGVEGIKPARGELILAGAVVVRAVMDAGGFDAIEATEAGLREGIFFAGHLDGDPPLFDDVRAASVLNLAAQYRVDPAHTAHVAKLALGLFDELAVAGVHDGDRGERELLWAACMLHDIGMSVDYDDHHKHSRYLVLNAGLPGFTQREVALVGQFVRYHRKGMPGPGPFGALMVDGDADRLARSVALLRLAEDLERSRDQSVRTAGVRVEDDVVRLTLESDGDVAVPRWAAAREDSLFRRAYGRSLAVD